MSRESVYEERQQAHLYIVLPGFLRLHCVQSRALSLANVPPVSEFAIRKFRAAAG